MTSDHRSFIATLYSVVLPGGERLRMEELRCLATDAKLKSPKTVGSTGNLVFESNSESIEELERLLERSFERKFGKFVPVFVR